MNKFFSLLLFIAGLFSITSAQAEPNSFKIYDCFIFFNELELLEIRLDELYDVVDKFVIVESTHTFRGKPKPLHFKNNQSRFERFADKIIYVGVETVKSSNPWVKEAFQRNCIMKGLTACSNDDIILISDVDEIPSKESIEKIVYALNTLHHQRVSCEQPLFRFFLNMRDRVYPWVGTVATTYSHLLLSSPESLRIERWQATQPLPIYVYPVIPDAGWHFSSMGDLSRVIQKIESYSHAEQDLPKNKTKEWMQEYIDTNCFPIEIDATFPRFILNHQEELESAGFIYAS